MTTKTTDRKFFQATDTELDDADLYLRYFGTTPVSEIFANADPDTLARDVESIRRENYTEFAGFAEPKSRMSAARLFNYMACETRRAMGLPANF